MALAEEQFRESINLEKRYDEVGKKYEMLPVGE